jgi:DNA-binding NarL/FixJ family response regulator
MPPTNTTEGLEAARTIREELPETAILVLSAHVEVEQATDLLARGERSGYLLKSRVTEVEQHVHSILRKLRLPETENDQRRVLAGSRSPRRTDCTANRNRGPHCRWLQCRRSAQPRSWSTGWRRRP